MSAMRLSMRMIKEILRLFFLLGCTFRQISRSTGVARSTVSEYVHGAQSAGLDWEKCRILEEDELSALLHPTEAGPPEPGKSKPDWSQIHEELRHDKNVTLTLLWHEYKEEYPDGYGLSQFHALYSRWRHKLGLVMRQVHRAGEKVFVDFCDGPTIVTEQGEVQETQIFVAVWGASNYTYVRAVSGQDLANWVGCHVAALEYFGCLPRIVVPDNLRSAVSRACRYEPDLNPTYQELAEHYGIAVIPARVRRARDKAKVEAGVLLVQRWILAVLRKRVFCSVVDLNAAIEPLLAQLNNKVIRVYKKSRRELFETLDRPAARFLPSGAYEYAEWKKAHVGLDYHILVEDHYYSVPHQLVGEDVFARITSNIVEVLRRNRRVASHVRSLEKGGKTTCREHMPRSHREHAGVNLEVVSNWAARTGPATTELFERILQRQHQAESAFNSMLGIYRLASRYGTDRIEKAAQRALVYGSCTYRSIRMILAGNLDQQPLQTENGSPQKLPLHENIRGSQYFNEESIL